MTGFPFTPQLGYNPTGNGDTRNPVRPNWNPDFQVNCVTHTAGKWFDPTAFAPPATGTYGHVSRNSLIGSGSSELDFSAAKTAHLTERLGHRTNRHSVHIEFVSDRWSDHRNSNPLAPDSIGRQAAVLASRGRAQSVPLGAAPRDRVSLKSSMRGRTIDGCTSVQLCGLTFRLASSGRRPDFHRQLADVHQLFARSAGT